MLEVRQARLTRLVLDLISGAKALSISDDLGRQQAGAQPVATGSGTSTASVQAISGAGLTDAVKMMEARCERK